MSNTNGMTSTDAASSDARTLRLCLLIPLFYTANHLHLQTQRLAERGASVFVVARRSPRNPEHQETYGSVQVIRVRPSTSGRVGNFAMLIYVLPSERDALPTTVMEAMACGLPVVASRVGGIVDMVSPRETGFLIEPRNVEHIAQTLEPSPLTQT